MDLVATISTHAKAIKTVIHKIISLPHINVAGVEKVDLERMLANITDFFLLPRDALHLAIIQRLGLVQIASDDMDFGF